MTRKSVHFQPIRIHDHSKADKADTILLQVLYTAILYLKTVALFKAFRQSGY